MARILTGRGTSLAWSAIAPAAPSGVSSPIVDIQSISFADEETLAEFLDGLARVNSHFKSTKNASITIETSDMLVGQALEIGTAFTNAILTIEGAVESTGVGVNGNYSITLGRAVLASRSELSHDNADSTPSTVELTFQLSRAAAATADPVVTKAVAGGGGS